MVDLDDRRGRVASAAVALTLALALGAAGCGGSEDGGSADGATAASGGDEPSLTGEQRAVSRVVERFVAGVRASDGAAMCDELSAAKVKEIEAGGRPCRAVLRFFSRNSEAPSTKIVGVRIDGRRAAVAVKQPGIERFDMPVVRERGEWKLDEVGAAPPDWAAGS